MGVTVYKSTDASAPTLSGTAGDLVNLLDKCLVTGYGSKAAAGWTKPYTSTNAAVFRQGAGCMFYLNVNDNAPGAGGAREARIVGYETMTAYATGFFLFPTAASLANGMFVRKSATADATTRVWRLYADARTFYLCIESGDSATTPLWTAFGDFYSFLKGDAYNCMIIGRQTENSATVTSTVEGFSTLSYGSQGYGLTGHYVARPRAGMGGAQNFGKYGDFQKNSATSAVQPFSGLLTYPHPVDSALHLVRPTMFEQNAPTQFNQYPTGFLRGVWYPNHAASAFTTGDTASGSGALAGKTFEMVKETGGNGGVVCMETSDTWEVSS